MTRDALLHTLERENNMSGGIATPLTPKEAAIRLCKLFEDKLDVKIDPVSMRLFLRSYWSRVSPYAHVIHDEKD
jgi:hypothetical protein